MELKSTLKLNHTCIVCGREVGFLSISTTRRLLAAKRLAALFGILVNSTQTEITSKTCFHLHAIEGGKYILYSSFIYSYSCICNYVYYIVSWVHVTLMDFVTEPGSCQASTLTEGRRERGERPKKEGRRGSEGFGGAVVTLSESVIRANGRLSELQQVAIT